MKLLYIFPHPDDESFGAAPGIAAQKAQGHEVHLLTLTKGGATKMRHEFGYSIEEMGNIRAQEMQCVKRTLDLDGMTILDLPDSGLKHLDPREIEDVCTAHIEALEPDVVVTYPVHGISGFHDHLVIHAVMKRVFCELRDRQVPYFKRLALFTMSAEQAQNANRTNQMHRISGSTAEEVDCRQPITDADFALMKASLACYKTYKKVIDKTIAKMDQPSHVSYEFFGERFDPPLAAITDELPE